MHPDEQRVRGCYDAFARRDMDAVLDFLADDITFVIPGTSIQSGTFTGKDGVRRYFSIVGEHTEGTHRVDVIEVFANENRAVGLLRALGKHDDRVFDMTVVHLWHLADGKGTQLSIIPTDQCAFDAFWS